MMAVARLTNYCCLLLGRADEDAQEWRKSQIKSICEIFSYGSVGFPLLCYYGLLPPLLTEIYQTIMVVVYMNCEWNAITSGEW